VACPYVLKEMDMDKKKILILGIGNSIRGDDAIGLLVARELAKQHWPGVEIKELETSGFEIIDEMAGYDKLIIIDALRTSNQDEIGEIVVSCLDDRIPTVTLMPSHGYDFAGLVETYRKIQPDKYPADIYFVLVKVRNVDEFRQSLSRELAMMFDELFRNVLGKVRELL
jgi:hydrogenase maturation protease